MVSERCLHPMFTEAGRGNRLRVHGWTDGEDVALSHTVEYDTATRKKEILPLTTPWTRLEGVTLAP